MLTNITLRNFKSFVQQSIELKPLTLLTGLNSSGKSTIIQAINMLAYYYAKGHIALQEHAAPQYLKSAYSKADYFELSASDDKNGSFSLRVTVNGRSYSIDEHPRNSIFPPIQYISAARLGPQNVLPLNSESSTVEIGLKGEYVLDYIKKMGTMQIADSLDLTDTKIGMLRQNVNEWLQIISPGNTFEAAPDEEHGQAFSKYNHFMPTESGFGLSYILPIITALLAPGNDHNLITIIENPEAHLHPKGQSEIGKLIAMAAAADKQVIVETHSDHIIDGIRIACRKKLINNEDIVFHYITKEGPEKAAEVDSVQPMPDGKLDHWPKGFFDQSLLDKAELLKK